MKENASTTLASCCKLFISNHMLPCSNSVWGIKLPVLTCQFGQCEKCSFTNLFNKDYITTTTPFEDWLDVDLTSVSLVWHEYKNFEFPNSKGKVRLLARMTKKVLAWDDWWRKFVDSLTNTVVTHHDFSLYFPSLLLTSFTFTEFWRLRERARPNV